MRACALALMLIFVHADADFITECPKVCDCKWQSGKKAANCSQRELNEVPDKLSDEIQNIDLSYNPLLEISPKIFESVGLCNLKKLWLHDCKLSIIDEDGFNGLSIITELDLSKNNIKKLHPNTFNEMIKLRYLIISENKLEQIEDGLFNDLPYLQKIDLRHNSIHKLGKNSFGKLPRLTKIYLQFNSLSIAEPGNLSKLENMTSLVLHDNPWKCDCHLELFRNWVIDRNLDERQTTCAEPKSLQGRLWTELTSKDFACRPNILVPLQASTIVATGKSITLSCHVLGHPKTEVFWAQNSKILDYISSLRYELKQTKFHGVSTQWTNLTIINLEQKDEGEYTCIAENSAGDDNRTVSLTLNKRPGATNGNNVVERTVNMVFWLRVTVTVIFLIAVLSFCIYLKRLCSETSSNSDMDCSNRELLSKGSVVSETLMKTIYNTTVNPMKKVFTPYGMTSSDTSGATEMREMSRGLLDNDSVFSFNDEEIRSTHVNQSPKRTIRIFSSQSSREDGETSLSVSSASNSSRLPQQLKFQSSLGLPINSQNSRVYTRDHPLSSFQSSPTLSVCPFVPKQGGYVIMPRVSRKPNQ